MQERHFIVFILAVFVVTGMSVRGSGIETPAQEKPPNILFIMSDDHTTQAIGAYGDRLAPLNPTPTIDRLAKEGMRFERVFCNNSICTPSRASILTGQYSQSNGVLYLGQALPSARQYLPTEIKKLGYQTAMIGKWHLSSEPAAFDHYCVLPHQGRYFNPVFRIRGPKDWPHNTIRKQDQHSSDAITDLSLDWLKNKRDKNRPFFLMHHFKAPHDMFQNAPRYNSYLEEVEILEPDNLFTPLAGSDSTRGMGSGLGKHAPWHLGKRLAIPQDLGERAYVKTCYQIYLKRYLRCVKGIDDNVKRLLDYLESAGELENTLVIYTSDQGFFLGEHDLMDKRWIYEESMRMPFIMCWPQGIREGQENDWLINNTDFAPTLLELAGMTKPPSYMQGRSFTAALKGAPQPADWRQVTYYRYWMHMAHSLAVPAHFGIRSDRYKLVFFYGLSLNPKGHPPTPPGWEFYDLAQDPHEMRNEYDNPEYATIIADMKTQLRATRAELNETDTQRPKFQKVVDANWDGLTLAGPLGAKGNSLGSLTDLQPEKKNYIKEEPEIAKRLKALHDEWRKDMYSKH